MSDKQAIEALIALLQAFDDIVNDAENCAESDDEVSQIE